MLLWQARTTRQNATSAPQLSGFDALGAVERARVRAALDAGVATLPDFIGQISGSRESLMGSARRTSDTFELTVPVGTAINVWAYTIDGTTGR
ncbi:MAG TPA: hypothetical protein VGX46_17060 [Vicinamibacterales bacterium]|nr:hypothetical protein [Vicinamibacterales bacterium]